MSGVPSESRSPIEATDQPNRSLSARDGPLGVLVVPFISTVLFMVPSEFMNITCTVPRSRPPASSNGAPAAMSRIPSESRSPTEATEKPNSSSSESIGPPAVPLTIPIVFLTVPLGFISIMCTVPTKSPSVLSPGAPAATSGIPSPSRSPMAATEEPKAVRVARDGPPGMPVLSILVTCTGYTRPESTGCSTVGTATITTSNVMGAASFPAASCAVQVTSVTSCVNVDPGAGEHVTGTIPSARSTAGDGCG